MEILDCIMKRIHRIACQSVEEQTEASAGFLKIRLVLYQVDCVGIIDEIVDSPALTEMIKIIFVVIILQEGNQQGVGVVTGGADTFFSKNKARSIDAFLSRWTKVFAVVFVLAVIGLNVLAYFT